MRRRSFLVGVIGGVIGGADLVAADEAVAGAIRATIERQLDALRRGDNAAAYGEAAPSIRTLFPDETRFMAMVRQGYPALIGPRDVRFGPIRAAGDGYQQIVELTDRDGKGWRALYTLERQADGSWKITGCYLVVVPGEAV